MNVRRIAVEVFWTSTGVNPDVACPFSRSSIMIGGGSNATRYSNCARNSSSGMPDGGRELRELVRILEVVAAQADHVAARDRVARRVHVDEADARAAGLADRSARANGIGTKWPPCIEIIARVAAREQVFRRAVAEVARVLHVERDRVGAAQLVADVLGDDRRLDAELLEPLRPPAALRISPMLTSAMRRWPCASRSTSCERGEVARARCRARRLRRSSRRRRAGRSSGA